MRILIIDDEPTILRVLDRMMKAHGHAVVMAGDGISGVEIFNSFEDQFDVVITDLNMPGMNGYEVGETIYAKRKLPIILYTGEVGADCKKCFYSVVDKCSPDLLLIQIEEINYEKSQTETNA